MNEVIWGITNTKATYRNDLDGLVGLELDKTNALNKAKALKGRRGNVIPIILGSLYIDDNKAPLIYKTVCRWIKFGDTQGRSLVTIQLPSNRLGSLHLITSHFISGNYLDLKVFCDNPIDGESHIHKLLDKLSMAKDLNEWRYTVMEGQDAIP